MIIRRIYRNFAKQDWAAVIIELLVVALGIFLGLQASNWNDDRIARDLERGYLIRLQQDVVASAEGLARDNRLLEGQLADQAVILASLEACDVAPEDALAFQRGVSTLGFVNPPRFFRRTVDDLAASGRLDIIQSDQIRDELARLVAEVEWRSNVMDSVFRNMDNHRLLIDGQVSYDLTTSLGGPEFLAGVDYDIQALCAQPQIRSAVSAISFHTRERLIAHRELFDRYASFLPLIERELRSRWGDQGTD